jgi:hypothetical protein
MLNILGIITSVLSKITDTFNRTDGSLGTSSSGNLWSILSGTWAISSNQATSSTAGSSYPLATVNIAAQDVIVSADITDGGPGVAFWVTDANSWWASSVNYRSTQTGQAYYTGSLVAGGQTGQAYYTGSLVAGGQTGQAYYTGSLVSTQTGFTCPGGCTPSGGACVVDGGPSEGQPCGSGTPVYSDVCSGPGGNSSTGGGNCGTFVPATFGPSTCSGPGGNPSTGGGDCGTFVAATYGSSTCSGAGGNSSTGGGDCGTFVAATNDYFTELKLYKNVSGTISTVQTTEINSNSSAFVEANSIKASTSGDDITITAYQSSGLSSAFATTLTNTPTTPLKGTTAGIIKTPSSTNVGSLIDNFSAESL